MALLGVARACEGATTSTLQSSELLCWAFACALLAVAVATYVSIVPRLVLSSFPDSGHAAELNSCSHTIQAAVTMVIAPTIGAMSDRYGRPLLFAANAIAICVTTVALALGLVGAAEWLVLTALTGALTCSDFVARAALSSGDAEAQASVYGLLTGASATGSVVGMQLAGAIASSYGARPALLCGAGFALAAAAFAGCLPDHRRLVVVPELSAEISASTAPAEGSPAMVAYALDFAIGCDAFACASFSSLGVIYCTTQYGLGPEGFAQLLTLCSGVSIAANVVLLPLLQRVLGAGSQRETSKRAGRVSRTDLLSAAAGQAMSGVSFALTATGSLPLLFLAAILNGAGSISQQGLIAARMKASGSAAISRQGGAIQGQVARIQGVSGTIAPLVLSSMYANVSHRSPFILAAVLELCTLAVVAWLCRNLKAAASCPSDLKIPLTREVDEVPLERE